MGFGGFFFVVGGAFVFFVVFFVGAVVFFLSGAIVFVRLFNVEVAVVAGSVVVKRVFGGVVEEMRRT